MARRRTRRRFVAGGATGLAAALAGCTSAISSSDDAGDSTDGSESTTSSGVDHPTEGFPLREESLYVADDFERLRSFVLDAGAPKDGIPPISAPQFERADEVGDRMHPQDPVFGLEVNGDARAYPQAILVWHEIVNDVVGGVPVAVTYCPLTGSALAFHRGENSFGTTGHLLNSNLVMYDRATDSRWPQLLATAIEGEHRGDSLSELRVTWTTFERWTAEHPDSRVLTRDTGFVRDYDRDPYGMYNPKSGYYATQGQLYDPLRDPGRTPPKLVLVATHTSTGSFGVAKDRLREELVVTGRAGDRPVVAVHDPTLDTGYVYERPDDGTVEPADDGAYRVDGDVAAADDLPLPALVDFDVMWFAWNALYPESDTYV